jgi:hypothetical protein
MSDNEVLEAPSTAVDEPKPSWERLAEEINRDIAIAEQSRKEVHVAYSTHLQDAIRVGQKLQEVRDFMDNSASFQAWVGRHLTISRSQAYKYMRIAKHRKQLMKKVEELLERSAAPLSQNEAIRTLDGGTISAAQIEEIIRKEQHDLPDTRATEAKRMLIKKAEVLEKVARDLIDAIDKGATVSDWFEVRGAIDNLAAKLIELMKLLDVAKMKVRVDDSE